MVIDRIVVLGFPRSGTNLLTRLLARYFDGPNKPTWDGMGVHHLVRKIHWEYQFADGSAGIEGTEYKTVHIVRDPRDVAVSGWFYYCKTEKITFSEFLHGPFSNGFFDGTCGWREHTESCIARNDTIEIQYERLCLHRVSALIHLGLAIANFSDLACARYAVELSHGERRKSYCSDRQVAAGTSEWRDIFDTSSIRFFKRRMGDVMERLGYTWPTG